MIKNKKLSLTVVFIAILIIDFMPSLSSAKEGLSPKLKLPLISASKRITKKPYGIKVSPRNSPVTPERFSGYHTGVDFEIFSGEENKPVPIYAICGGSLIYKKYVNGYGGVAVQSCQIGNQKVTIVYGHLKFASIISRMSSYLKSGDKIGILGKGYSRETNGERKHLHLGIHIGTSIDLRGYVKTKKELDGWINAAKYLSY